MFALLISPVSQLPTIVNQDSREYAELTFMGYEAKSTGTKKKLERLEEEIMQDFVAELDLPNEEN